MVNKPITLKDVCNNCKEQDSFIDMTEFYVEDYKEIMAHLKPLDIGGVDVTIMDLFNIPLGTDEEIINFIKTRLNIDIESKSGIEKINDLFEKAKDLYEKRYLRTLSPKIKNQNFKNPISIINFIKETKTNKTSGVINCSIAKITYAVNDVLSNEKFRRAHFLDQQFIKEHLEKPFQIEEGYEDKNGNIYRNGKVVINGKIINFKLIARQKGIDSIVGKEIFSADYYSVDKFMDLVGGTIYIENDVDCALMMQYIDQMIYKGQSKIKNKNGLNLREVKEGIYLNKEFYEKLTKETKKNKNENEISQREKDYNINNNTKKGTAKNYKEIKLIGLVDLSLEEGGRSKKSPIGTEIKFVVGGHDNESGLSFQSIYDYIKRFRELTRLGIPIRELDIVNYVNDFFENIDYLLKKKNKEKNNYYEELFQNLVELGFIEEDKKLNGIIQNNEKIIALGLYNYFLSKLIQIKFPHSKKTYYFDENILNLRDVGLYKKFEKI